LICWCSRHFFLSQVNHAVGVRREIQGRHGGDRA
jgi:hypothetical protein